MKYTKIFIVILIVVLLTSCGESLSSTVDYFMNLEQVKNSDKDKTDSSTNDGWEDKENTSSDKTDKDNHAQHPGQPSDPFEGLYHKDFGGIDFVIAAYDKTYVFPTGTDSLSRAIKERNSLVEQEYNIKIVDAGIGKEEFYTKIANDYKSGIKTCDLIIAPADIIAIFKQSDMLLSMNALPFVDYTKDYYDQKATASATAVSFTYAVFGDAVPSFDNYWCIYFNRDIFDIYGTEYPYDRVMAGDWTWDDILQMCDLFNNGKLLYASDSDELIDIVWSSSGINFFENDTHSMPKMIYNTDKTKETITLIKKLLKDKRIEHGADANRLANGDYLFGLFPLSYAMGMADTTFEWGILPIPACTDGSDYYTYEGGNSQAMCVLNICNGELSGIITEALSAASYNITESFKELYMNYFLRDNSSVLMLDTIMENPYFDTGYTLGQFEYEFASASYEILKSVITKNLDFDKLYGQNVEPFELFIRENYNVVD